MRKRGFTLLEVNLAIMVMASGVLGMCALYSLGFRESRQSVEDVAGVAFADAYLAPLVQGLSATNMTWTQWCSLGANTSGDQQTVADGVLPAGGWRAYVRQVSVTSGRHRETTYRVQSNPNGRADGVFGEVIGKVPSEYRGARPAIDGNYSYGLVMTRTGAKIQLAFRVSRRQTDLMMQPVFVSEVHFQGDPDR